MAVDREDAIELIKLYDATANHPHCGWISALAILYLKKLNVEAKEEVDALEEAAKKEEEAAAAKKADEEKKIADKEAKAAEAGKSKEKY